MSEEANKAAVRGFFNAIDGAQGMAPLDAVAAPDYQAHFPGMPTMNRDGIKGFGNVFFDACPGLRHNIEELMADGDLVAARLTIRGTHTRPFAMPTGTLPATGKSFEMPVMNMYRFAGGKVAEHWAAFDMLGFLKQLGAIPS